MRRLAVPRRIRLIFGLSAQGDRLILSFPDLLIDFNRRRENPQPGWTAEATDTAANEELDGDIDRVLRPRRPRR